MATKKERLLKQVKISLTSAQNIIDTDNPSLQELRHAATQAAQASAELNMLVGMKFCETGETD